MTQSETITGVKFSADYFASLTPAMRATLISQLSENEARQLYYDWQFWARKNQLPPPGDWFIWLMLMGRGAGKTRSGAEYCIDRVKRGYLRLALIGQTKADVRDTMVELGESSLLQISPPWFMPHYEPSKRRVTWPNGGIAIIYSGDEPDQLRGPQHDTAWVDEIAKFKYPQETWDNLEFGLRLGDDPRVVVTTTPKPIPIIKQLIDDPEAVTVRGSTYENIANLSPRFIERVVRRYEGTRLGRQELHAVLLEDAPGALWRRANVDALRVTEYPGLVTIVVGVDPPGSATGAECGIIVVALGTDHHVYVLDDVSLQGAPAVWANQAVSAYRKWQADRIIGEVNNGGDMVEHTIRTVDPYISFKAVRATRGKQIRAEPVAAVYTQKKAHHVGNFGELEDQLCQWEPGDKSPDRLDALVWAVTDLVIAGATGFAWGVD